MFELDHVAFDRTHLWCRIWRPSPMPGAGRAFGCESGRTRPALARRCAGTGVAIQASANPWTGDWMETRGPMTRMLGALIFLTFVYVLTVQQAHARNFIADKYPDSLLYSAPVEVIPNVWTAIGATQPSTYENAGHNNNLSFLITGEGVVVVNGGGSYLLAKALHDEIKKITDQPVVQIINENGQGHAMLGNSYWAELGVPILAHVDAAAEFDDRGLQNLENAQARLRERADGTWLAMPTETFEDKVVIELGTMRIEVLRLGPAHSPGDISVWLPEEKLVIAGDIAFQERIPPIFENTVVIDWIETFETEFEALEAVYVIPGHGHPTNMAQVRRYTTDYLRFLREQVGEYLEGGGDLAGAYYVDQSPYEWLHTFQELATRNAGRVFEQMEFE
jgi:glyoxylase-like metal-dependent hydrolase (beta-lactamase superfamily II)